MRKLYLRLRQWTFWDWCFGYIFLLQRFYRDFVHYFMNFAGMVSLLEYWERHKDLQNHYRHGAPAFQSGISSGSWTASQPAYDTPPFMSCSCTWFLWHIFCSCPHLRHRLVSCCCVTGASQPYPIYPLAEFALDLSPCLWLAYWICLLFWASASQHLFQSHSLGFGWLGSDPFESSSNLSSYHLKFSTAFWGRRSLRGRWKGHQLLESSAYLHSDWLCKSSEKGSRECTTPHFRWTSKSFVDLDLVARSSTCWRRNWSCLRWWSYRCPWSSTLPLRRAHSHIDRSLRVLSSWPWSHHWASRYSCTLGPDWPPRKSPWWTFWASGLSSTRTNAVSPWSPICYCSLAKIEWYKLWNVAWYAADKTATVDCKQAGVAQSIPQNIRFELHEGSPISDLSYPGRRSKRNLCALVCGRTAELYTTYCWELQCPGTGSYRCYQEEGVWHLVVSRLANRMVRCVLPSHFSTWVRTPPLAADDHYADTDVAARPFQNCSQRLGFHLYAQRCRICHLWAKAWSDLWNIHQHWWFLFSCSSSWAFPYRWQPLVSQRWCVLLIHHLCLLLWLSPGSGWFSEAHH